MQEGIECPKCGKRTVVQRSETVFQCISCDFKRDLATEPKQNKNNNEGGSWLGVLLTFALIIIAFSLGTSSTFLNSEVNQNVVNPVTETIAP
ncbi:hypothetical protein [Lyngbya sp. CCY1209]|jgi:hypothetical protein|uniref:hypothetical protein n=1 Tax=Lyngbya sp. CCY1209 TaxID=2886103 RepID=UPI002D21515E|nr:hypothetical protein [Lyngbya sp. CCY1209]MEB3887036.1 hypothetical protein [Lyngbya sp. CCY1209]